MTDYGHNLLLETTPDVDDIGARFLVEKSLTDRKK